MFHCDEDFLPTATQNIIDAVTHVRKCKCIVIVVGGNTVADLANVQSASEYGHPIIVLESTGGLADEIASAYREHERTGNYPRTPIGSLVKRSFMKVFETDDFEDEGELTALMHFMMLTNIFD